MFKEEAGNSTELPHQATRKYLEKGYCENVREVYEIIDQSGLDRFVFPLIDSLCNDLNAVVYELERLPESTFKDLIDVTGRLAGARNELRLARFLFDVEEIDPVRRLVLRNKAVLRGKQILHKVLLVWPLYNSTYE